MESLLLNIEKKIKSQRAVERSMTELLPWLTLVSEQLVLTKDGGLLACFQMNGLPMDRRDQEKMDRNAEQFERAVRSLEARITLWFTVKRTHQVFKTNNAFVNPVSAEMVGNYEKGLEDHAFFCNKTYISILYRFDPKQDGWLFRFLRGSGHGFWSSLKGLVSHQHAEVLWQAGIQERMRQCEELLSEVLGILTFSYPKRLSGNELLAFLHDMTSPVESIGSSFSYPASGYLDQLLVDNRLSIGSDVLHFQGVVEEKFGAILALKGWAGETYPGQWSLLLELPCELVFSQVFQCVDQEEAKKYIKSVQRFHLNLQRSLMSYVREAISGEQSVVHDTGRKISADEARAAVTDMVAEKRIFGYHNLSVLVLASNRAVLEQQLTKVANVIRVEGYLILRERLHLTCAWAGQIPGQWGELVRWHLISTANLADLCPLDRKPIGEDENKHFTKQRGVFSPALATFPSNTGQLYHFNWHFGDLGHGFVIGPSRSGKSVFMNYLISAFQKYAPVRTIIFDKDRSCRIATLMQGGVCLDYEWSGLAMNPFTHIQRQSYRHWLVRWLEILITARGYHWTSQDDLFCAEALEGLVIMPPKMWQLKSLQGLLPRHLRQEIEPWVDGGPLSGFFDHEQDDLNFGSITTIEMSAILRDRRVARVFLEYAMQRIEQELNGLNVIPTLIYIEEAWFMLSDEYFAQRLRDWLKTLPKKLGSVILATQSLDDLTHSPIFSSLSDNIPTRVFLPNPNALVHRELYQNQFGLSLFQIEQLMYGVEKQDYWVQTPLAQITLHVRFEAELLYYLRSDAQALSFFESARKSGAPDWAQHYLSAMREASHD